MMQVQVIQSIRRNILAHSQVTTIEIGGMRPAEGAMRELQGYLEQSFVVGKNLRAIMRTARVAPQVTRVGLRQTVSKEIWASAHGVTLGAHSLQLEGLGYPRCTVEDALRTILDQKEWITAETSFFLAEHQGSDCAIGIFQPQSKIPALFASTDSSRVIRPWETVIFRDADQ